MAKQRINLGTSANKGDGDPLRTAFDKVNDNFDELYATSGLSNSELGAFEFTDNVMTTTDSSAIVIDQATTITSDLTVDGDILPARNLQSTLGSPTNKFHSIYVGTGSVYLGDARLSLVNGKISSTVGFKLTDTQIDDALPSQTGNAGKFLTTDGSNNLSWGAAAGGTGDRLVNGSLTAALTDKGTLTTPLLLPRTFTAVLDNNHMVTGTPISGTPWQFEVAFVVGSNGVVETQMDNPFPNPTNPGYASGDEFLFVEADHGIPEFTFVITLNDVVLPGGAGWTANPAVSEPPEYPSTVASLGAVKLTANTEDFVFGTDGKLRLPVGGDILDSTGTSVLGSEGLPTVTVPAEAGTTYKGLQVSYGMVHSNSGTNELNVNKIVIHKPAVTTTTIDPTSSQDNFQVSGLVGDSDVLALFVLYGDVNGAKPLSDLQAFAEEVIDLVILTDGVEDAYNTVDAMKAAFYTNYADLAAAANGLDIDFQFFDNVLTLNGGVTTVREGSGAIFEISQNDVLYGVQGIQNNGTNYLPGHKILVLGTDLGGATPDNDCVVTVDSISEGGAIFQWSVAGVAVPADYALYTVTGTNYQIGSGFAVSQINTNGDVNVINLGTGYVVGDVITLLGANLTNGTTPENNFTITVTGVDGSGQVFNHTTSGVVPRVWRTNSINDGGNDQYDTGNYISTNFANEIGYNDGETVADGVAVFGTDSTYTFVYDTGIFGLFALGSSATLIRTSGNSGADGNSVTEAGNIYGPNTAAQTFDNAVTHINIIGNPYAGPLITFTRTNYGDEVDEISEGLHITKNNQGWLYNALEDEGHGNNTPTGSRWNNDGWDDFTDVESRIYTSLESIWGGNFQNIPGAKMIMLDETTDKYWAIEFLSWTNNANGGGAAYTRQELDLTSLVTGIRFSDGTTLNSAEGIGRVKLTSPGNRRIEEVAGYKQVAVTGRTTSDTITTTAQSSNSGNTWQVNINAEGTAFSNLIALTNLNGVYTVQVSADQTSWIDGYVGGNNGSTTVQIVFNNGATLAFAQETTVYYRIVTGGDPVVWWSTADLPSGSGNFRGAVIDYHAYTGEATIIGTIHIVDDDGEENVTHTEVSSGSTDSENDELWLVQNEGTISYRRIDGESKTLRIQWTAKVFYGSELYD